MDKINFENLPLTTTPINAENLNKMQDNIEKEIVRLESVKDYQITNLPEHSAGSNVYSLLKSGNKVVLNVDNIWVNSITKDTWISLGNVPSEIKPSSTIGSVAAITEGSGGNVIGIAKVGLTDSGLLRVKANTTYSHLSSFGFELVWLL